MKVVGYFDIFKRYISFNENNLLDYNITKKNCDRLYEIAKQKETKLNVVKFFTECSNNPYNAQKYIRACITFLESFDYDKELYSIFEKSILPKVVDNDELSDIVEASAISDSIKKDIKIQIVKNKVCDRILENHNRITKVSDIDKVFNENSKADLSFLINKCCNVIDQFNLKTYAKLNASIEEAVYLLGKNDIKYTDKQLVDGILSYYLCKEVTVEDMMNMDKVLKENYCISEDASEDAYNNPISLIISKYNCSDKSDMYLNSTVGSIMSCSIRDLCLSGFDELMRLLLVICISKSANANNIIDNIIPDLINKITVFQNDDYYRDLLITINSILENQIRLLSDYYLTDKYTTDEDLINSIWKYKTKLEELNSQVKDQLSFAETKYNKDCKKDNLSEDTLFITLDEFKVFKFDNLINIAKRIDKAIMAKTQKFRNKLKNGYKKIHSKIFSEVAYSDMINNNGNIDFCICTYNVNEVTVKEHEIFSQICKEVNEEFAYNGITCYYEAVSNSEIEIHMKSNIIISVDENFCIMNFEDYDRLNTITELAEMIDSNNIDKLSESEFIKFFKETKEDSLFELFIPTCELANIDPDIVSNVFNAIKEYKDESFYYRYNYLVENYTINNSDVETQLEATNLLLHILEANIEITQKKSNNKDDKNNDKKPNPIMDKINSVRDSVKNKINKNDQKEKDNEEDSKDNKDTNLFKGINFNSIKLSLDGLKKKAKDMSAKEKEFSRNLDTSVNKLITDMKNALISDRRESIIKGSVIPSFSKFIKLCVGAAGLYLINPAAAVIAAIGGFIASKKLTKKERALLLDEIEVELEMVEKEISIAESKNQMKKLRQLMIMKKDLERTYQRIKLNVRLGKDIMPGATYGRKSYND